MNDAAVSKRVSDLGDAAHHCLIQKRDSNAGGAQDCKLEQRLVNKHTVTIFE